MKIFQIFEKFGEILPPDQQVEQTGFNECSTEESGGGQLQKQVENILEILTVFLYSLTVFRLFAVGGMGVEDDLCSVEVFSPTSGQCHYLPAQMKEVNGWCSACLGKKKCTMVTWQQV